MKAKKIWKGRKKKSVSQQAKEKEEPTQHQCFFTHTFFAHRQFTEEEEKAGNQMKEKSKRKKQKKRNW